MKKQKKKGGLKDDVSKLRYDLITLEALEGMAEVLTYGAKKYAPNTWQNVEDGYNRHYSALLRHLLAWKSGQRCDSETGYSHMKHVLTNAMFLLYHETHNARRYFNGKNNKCK